MIRVRKLKLSNHPVLGNLELDFTDSSNKAVDTVIIAGNNGIGKSSLVELLYQIMAHKYHDMPCYVDSIEVDFDSKIRTYEFYAKDIKGRDYLYVKDGLGLDNWVGSDEFAEIFPTSAIFSDVDINFKSDQITNVTSRNIDESVGSIRSSSDLPTEINQLIIDIQALDDADVARVARNNMETGLSQLQVPQRMPRFTKAFDLMFDDLKYYRVDNRDGHKEILFKKNGHDVRVDQLSSGEKQIVYRGCFMLKDSHALRGSFVFIDEPEISLHPSWQEKILHFYKSLFQDEDGSQTSQIFCVTHSPFIIHDENRYNDKVIVLAKNEFGEVVAQTNPEFYGPGTVQAVKDAFSVSWFANEVPTVYLEGPTDEQYFNKALSFAHTTNHLRFKWIGKKSPDGSCAFTGAPSLNKAAAYLDANPPSVFTAFLFDCDQKINERLSNNVLITKIETYKSRKHFKKGVENALVLDDDFDTSAFYQEKQTYGDYGDKKVISEFQKQAFCDYICSLPEDELRQILTHLIEAIERIDNQIAIAKEQK